jgi:hypothetical protein
MTALDLVYQYRLLVGKCESGVGLDFDEIEALGAIEALFANPTGDDGEATLRGRRQFARERVSIQGVVRGARLNDPVHIVDLGPGGMVCRTAPYMEEGQLLEVVIDDEELGLSYRFKACVSWLRDDVDDDYAIGLRFVGTPILIHRGPQREHVDDVDAAIAA